MDELENALPDNDTSQEGGGAEDGKGADEDFDFDMDMDFSRAKKKKKKRKDLDELVAEEEAVKPEEKDSGKMSIILLHCAIVTN